MTLNELTSQIGRHPQILAAIFGGLPLLTWLLGRLHDRPRGGARAPWRYVYSAVAYLVCVPGTVAAVLVAYTVFFVRRGLFELDLMVFFLPPISMFFTLILMGRNVDFDDLPGFDRLSGFIILIAVSFAVALAVHKTMIWIFFSASIGYLAVFAVIAYLMLSWATRKMMGHPR